MKNHKNETNIIINCSSIFLCFSVSLWAQSDNVKITKNSDGSETITTKFICTICYGTGKMNCTCCGGMGQRQVFVGLGYNYSPIYNYVLCQCCIGQKTVLCNYCGGRGYSVTTSTYYPNIPVEPVTHSGVSDYNNSSGGSTSGNGNNNNQRSSDYGYVDCHMCYGSGKCNTCNGKGTTYSYILGHDVLCAICNGGRKCNTCSGSGKRYQRINK